MSIQLGDSVIQSAGNLSITSGHDVKHVYNASQINIGTTSGTNGFLTVDGAIFADDIFTTSSTGNSTGYPTRHLGVNDSITHGSDSNSSTSTTYAIASNQIHTFTPSRHNSLIQVYVTLACGVQKTGTDNEALGNYSAIFLNSNGTAKSTTKRIGVQTWNEDQYRYGIINSQWTAAIGTNRTSVIYQPIVFVETFSTSEWINSDGTVKIAPYYRVYPDGSTGYAATAIVYDSTVSWLEYV